VSNRRALLVCALAFWLSAADISLAQDGQPTQRLVRVASDDSLSLAGIVHKPVYEMMTYQYQVDVPYQETYNVEVNGETRQQSRTVMKPETRTGAKTVSKLVAMATQTPLDLKTAKGFEVDGRTIAAADLKKRLTDQTLVVVSPNDDMLPNYYAAVFKPGTVILALPPDPSGYPGAMPAPQVVPLPPPAPGQAPPPQAALPLGAALVRAVSFPPVAVPAERPEENLLPNSPAPLIVFATRSGADALKIRQYVETPTETELTVLTSDSSVAKEVPIKVRKNTRHSETTTVPLKSVRFSSSEGKDIAADRVKDRLGAGETTVLVSADGQPVDDFWLQNIQAKILVLRGVKLPPVSAGGGMMSPMAYPAPMPVQPLPPPTPGPAPVAPQPAPPQPVR
jgi:hypothetical protein